MNNLKPGSKLGGNPIHPSDEIYLSSWKVPQPLLPPTHHQDEPGRVGAPRRKPASKSELVALEGLIQPRPSRNTHPLPPGKAQLSDQASLDRLAIDAIMSKLATSTKKVYASGWKPWELFSLGAGASLFLGGNTAAEKSADEQRLIRFAVFLHQIMRRSVGGIRQRLSAIRYAHISAGYPDPLIGIPRLWAAIAGPQRWEGAPLRKLPVSPGMLRWLIKHLRTSGFPAQDQVVIKAALLTGWFFMLRA